MTTCTGPRCMTDVPGGGPCRFCRRLPACGAWMPIARERCARRPGHAADSPHRTRDAVDYAYLMAVGHERRAA